MRCIAILVFVWTCVGLTGCGQQAAEREEMSPSRKPIDVAAATEAIEGGLWVQPTWSKPLTARGGGANQVELRFLSSEQEPATGVNVLAFHPRMPAHGNHGTDESAQVFEPAADGRSVVVRGIHLSMPGDAGAWVTTMSVRFENATYTFKLPLPEVEAR